MIIDKKTRFLVVGLGLMGGSYARGLTQKGYHVDAIVNDEKSKEFALKHEIVEKCSDFVDEELIKNADVLIFALYPHTFVEWIKENGALIKKDAVITDVTGVKGCIVEKIQSLLPPGRTDRPEAGIRRSEPRRVRRTRSRGSLPVRRRLCRS